MSPPGPAARIAADVRAGRVAATTVAREALARMRAGNDRLRAATRMLDARALAEAAAVDAVVAAGGDPGPLAGVPYGVKDLFDVAGLPTTAGAAMLADGAPAAADAEAVRRMRAAGAVLVATCNMDAFAYGFATVNAAFGTTRNPHDPARLAGGSSGGSAAAVAAGMVPLALGSDTNGSVRVPAALCGVWGLKPTHGALPMAGVYPFVDSFDDVGPFARTAGDLALVTRVLAGEATRAALPTRIARLGGWFARNVSPAATAGIDRLAEHVGAVGTVELPEVDRARSAAFLMTAAEGGALHLPALRRDALAFDPAVRDRLLAGALLPAGALLVAHGVRARFRAAALALFERYDVLVAPCVGDVAPRVDAATVIIEGTHMPARAHLGLFTQPISFIGLPVVAAPLAGTGGLPLGVQLIGAPGRDAALLALAEALEADGLLAAAPAPMELAA